MLSLSASSAAPSALRGTPSPARNTAVKAQCSPSSAPHPHAFLRAGAERWTAEITAAPGARVHRRGSDF
ncbi:hypothetical protein ACMHYB_21950 [Sorangium sp. So ce1128]